MSTLTLSAVADFAALELGVLDSGESISTQQLADFLYNLNNAIDNWSNEQDGVPSVLITSFALVASQQKYTIGTGQNFNITRPVNITAAQHLLTFQTFPYETPVEVQNARGWAANQDRGSMSIVVRKMFYDRGYPTGNVFVSPIPLYATSIELTTWQPLPQFADTTTPLTIPPGYADFYNLLGCLVMAPQFESQLPPTVQTRFTDEIARIRNLNASLLGSSPPAGQESAAAPQGAITGQ